MRHSTAFALAGLVLLAGLAAPAMAQGPIGVQLGLAQEFYYEDDALELQIRIQNLSDQKQPNPVRTPLLEGLSVRTAGGETLKPLGEVAGQEPERPDELAPGSFYGTVTDITQLYPQLKKQGVYQIHWSGSGLISRALVVTILPRFDLDMDYDAVVETSLGSFAIRLFVQQSPIAVKSFIDMARVGVYEGMQIHEVHYDSFILGGDPLFADRPRETITFPAEFKPLPIVSGTVVLRPAGAAPPANSSAFMITLRPQPEWAGQVTVLGQVTQGLDVVRRMSQVPSSGRNSKPFFKPVEPIVINKVTINGVPRPPAPVAGP